MMNGASDEPSVESLRTRTWDVAVIGAGAGGATLGYDLARRGHTVIFIERGQVQSSTLDAPSPQDAERARLNAGRWPADLTHHDGLDTQTFPHALGCGTGGSSALFGMVLERFRPVDFEPGRFFPDAGDSTVPDTWPISYADLERYYDEAERLYRVHGSPDPLFPDTQACLPPPPATNKERSFLAALGDSGLHPYRFHYACERVAGCDGCPGRICRLACRNDAHRMCLVPAVETFGADLLSGCRVQRLECSNRTVSEVVARRQDDEIRVKARVVVLAANTFASPLILLRSKSERFPDGLANSSGMVGRNLMFHASDSLLVNPRRGLRSRLRPMGSAMNHGIGINDFYLIDGVKHGNIHAHPIPVSRDSVATYLRMRYARRAAQFPPIVDAAAWIGATIFAGSTYFATVVDDLPYAENRVLPDQSVDDRIAYAHTIHDELRTRAKRLVRRFSDAIAARCSVSVIGAQCNINRGHPCGTLRFGHDPRASVLDATNRAHDLDNLYAVDASFFPTSGGINPALTIAANALRVAGIIAARL